MINGCFLMFFLVVGDFLTDKDQDQTVVATVGKTFALNCPKHAHSQRVTYNWYYKQASEQKPLPDSDNYFVANNGTLYFSILRDQDVDFINGNDGIFCEQRAEVKGSGIVAKQSYRIKMSRAAGMVWFNSSYAGFP